VAAPFYTPATATPVVVEHATISVVNFCRMWTYGKLECLWRRLTKEWARSAHRRLEQAPVVRRGTWRGRFKNGGHLPPPPACAQQEPWRSPAANKHSTGSGSSRGQRPQHDPGIKQIKRPRFYVNGIRIRDLKSDAYAAMNFHLTAKK
jgi:hypothetical protein